MIYTLTINPALDLAVFPESFEIGKTNRSKREYITLGGKGINVSYVLKELETKSVALGFVAGFTGNEIKRLSEENGVFCDYIEVEGFTRINVKIKGEAETEINGNGPVIDENAVNLLFKKLDLLKEGDALILSGSIPSSLGKDFYGRILMRLKDKKILSVVDASGEALRAALSFSPFLIKPNRQEITEFLKISENELSLSEAAEALQKLGARNVIISLGGDGAFMRTENGEEFSHAALSGKVLNTVGAGDSMIAGFMASYLKEGSYEKAFLQGVAAGSATAFSDVLATKSEIMAQLERL